MEEDAEEVDSPEELNDNSETSEGSWGSEIEEVPVEETPENIEEDPIDSEGTEPEPTENEVGEEEPTAASNVEEESSEEPEVDQHPDVSWGDNSVTACTALDDCDDSNMQCSQVATCLPKGELGTYGIGDSCSDISDCAYGLECLEQICMDGGE